MRQKGSHLKRLYNVHRTGANQPVHYKYMAKGPKQPVAPATPPATV